MPTFSQLVIGPPGSGKTTYCYGMHQFLNGIGRPTIVVNLDPANDEIPYECDVNIQDLVSLEEVMEKFDLGPNGGMIYCLEYLEKNIDWLQEKLSQFITRESNEQNDDNKNKRDHYIIFDCPGQVELYTHNDAIKNITEVLQKWDFRFAAVHLVDSHYCSDPSKFISVLLLSLSTMVKLELPHINVLSKIDLLEQYGKLAFDIEYFADVHDLKYLIQTMEDAIEQKDNDENNNNSMKDDDNHGDEDLTNVPPTSSKFVKLNKVIADVIQDYGLVSFTTLNIQDKISVLNVLKYIDKCNGYIFGTLENMRDIVSKDSGKWNYER